MGRLSTSGLSGFLKSITVDIFRFQVEDQYQKAIAKGGVLSLAGLIFLTGSNLIYQLVLAQSLSPADYGIFNLGSAIALTLGLVIVFGLDRTIVYLIPSHVVNGDREKERGAVGTTLAIYLVTSLAVTPITWLAAPFVAEVIFNKPELTQTLQLLTLGLPFLALTRILVAVMQAYKNIKPGVVIEQILVPILRIAVLLFAFYLVGQSTASAAASSSLTLILGALTAGIGFALFWRSKIAGFKLKMLFREILILTWPLFFASLLNRANSYTETLFLGVLSTSDQIGLYSLSFKISMLVIIFYEAIHVVLAPYFGELFAKGAVDNLRSQYQAVTHWTFLVTLPVVLFFLISAPAIFALFDPVYLKSIPIFRVLVIAQLLYVLIGPAALTLIMTGHARLNLIDLVINFILSILLDILLIPAYGAFGAAVAGAITIVVVNIIRAYQVNQKFQIQPFSQAQISTLTAGAVAGIFAVAAAYLLQGVPIWINLMLTGLVILISYGLFLLIWTNFHRDSFMY